MGSASLVAILCGALKNKIAALYLGPGGFGLLALLQSALSFIATLAGLGLASSGVQMIAALNTGSRAEELTYTKRALLGGSFILGVVGTMVMSGFRVPIARWFFGNDLYSKAIAMISIGVWATVLSGAQSAILNGLHKISKLAKANAFGAIGSMIITAVAFWQWKEGGINLAVLGTPFASLAASWWFSRNVESQVVVFDWDRIQKPFKEMLPLGFVFMATSLMVVGSQFLARVIVTRKIGLDATGHFQAAWAISMLYLGFVLNAMGADYYPRISAAAHDHALTRTLANEQAEVALLLAAPVILGMMALSPLIISLLYSHAFAESVEILRWQLFGDVFKIGAWSIGYILLGGRFGRIFLFTEMSFHLVYLSLIWFGINALGLEITGIAFLIAYAYHFLLIWFVVRRTVGFSWNREVIGLFALVLLAVGATFVLSKWHSNITFAFIITGLMSAYSFRRLSNMLSADSLLFRWRR